MQVIASKPRYLNKEDIPEEVLENEKRILKEGIINNNTNKELNIDKILNSKLNNFIEENILNEQLYVIIEHDVKDNKAKVKEIVAKKGKELGYPDLKISEFKYYY